MIMVIYDTNTSPLNLIATPKATTGEHNIVDPTSAVSCHRDD